MNKYTLTQIEAIEGKQIFYKLEINGYCQFDEYESKIGTNARYMDELFSIYGTMEDVANNKLVPKEKFKDITLSSKDPIKEYEFKSKHLRVYAIKCDDGKIIILGGKKNKQKREIKRFRSIKKDYIASRDYEKRNPYK